MRTLLRGYLDPLAPVGADEIVATRKGFNSGNLVFSAAAQRLLTTAEDDVQMMPMGSFIRRPEWVNENFDHLVLPLANAFRPGFVPWLDRMTRMIERLTIPVTILGVGAQGSLDYSLDAMERLAEPASRFVSAVLDKSPSIGVRGHFTAEYLAGLGFRDVHVIGCPSMFFHGPNLPAPQSVKKWSDRTPVALNITPRVAHPQGWIRRQLVEQPRLTYVAQDKADIEVMLGGKPFRGPNSDVPGHLLHPFFAEDRTAVHLNALTWIEEMKKVDFAYGSRIHGNVVALLAGVRAHVIVHDSRTRELAEFFDIPHTSVRDLSENSTARSLYEESDFTAMMSGHEERFANFAAFLDTHGLAHADFSAAELPFDERARQRVAGSADRVTVGASDPFMVAKRSISTAKLMAEEIAQLYDEVDELKLAVRRLEQRPDSPDRSRSFVGRLRGKLRGLTRR